MNEIKIRSLFCLFLLCITGCTIGPKLTPEKAMLFVLTLPAENAEATLTQKSQTLILRNATTNPFFSGKKIAFSSSPYERGYYQYAHWAEPVPEKFASLLLSELERINLYATVSKISAGAQGELQLNVDILEFLHDTSEHPGKTKINIRCELLDTLSRKLIASKTFTEETDVESYSAEGAVKAFNEGTEKVITAIILWLDKTA